MEEKYQEPQSGFSEIGGETVVEPLGITDKFIGVLTEPSATFENIRLAGPRTPDWLIPLLALVVILVAGTILKFSNPEFVEDMKKQTSASFEKLVKDGKMTQEQADEALETTMGYQKTFAPILVLIGTPIVMFLIVLIYWLIVKFAFKGSATFVMILSVCGLVMYYGVIDQLITLLLGYATGNASFTFSPAAFMHRDMENKLYLAAMFFDPISIFSYYIQALGFEKVAQISRQKALIASFGLWLLWLVLSVALGGMFAGR